MFFVDAGNNVVGIGTSSPSGLLHTASTGAANIKLEDTDNGFAATELNIENGGRDFKITTPQAHNICSRLYRSNAHRPKRECRY